MKYRSTCIFLEDCIGSIASGKQADVLGCNGEKKHLVVSLRGEEMRQKHGRQENTISL